MACLLKNGTETLRVELMRKTYSFRSNGKALRNEGDGWKLVTLAEGKTIDDLREQVLRLRDHVTPEFKAYRQAVQLEFPLSNRWKFLELVNLMPEDGDGIWAHLEDEGIHTDIETVHEILRLRQAAVKVNAQVA